MLSGNTQIIIPENISGAVTGVTINDTVYTTTAIPVDDANYQLIIDWLNSLGTGITFYGTLVNDSNVLYFIIYTDCNAVFDSSKINKISGYITVDFNYDFNLSICEETLEGSLACIFSKFENSFCGNCKCNDICKNKNSLAIQKATLMMREIELLKAAGEPYESKLEEYSAIIKMLCQCK
jgi:uncharacterized protein YozE (UPF0346 family)